MLLSQTFYLDAFICFVISLSQFDLKNKSDVTRKYSVLYEVISFYFYLNKYYTKYTKITVLLVEYNFGYSTLLWF